MFNYEHISLPNLILYKLIHRTALVGKFAVFQILRPGMLVYHRFSNFQIGLCYYCSQEYFRKLTLMLLYK